SSPSFFMRGFRGHVLSLAGTDPIARVFWLLSDAEADASVPTSASSYHVEENVFVISIVEAVLKLREIQRQIFLAHVMIRAKHATLEQRPERFDAVCMDLTAHVLAGTVRDHFVRHRPFQIAITGVLIGRDQLYFVAN